MPPYNELVPPGSRQTRADVLKVLRLPMLVCMVPYGVLVVVLAVRILVAIWGAQDPDWKVCVVLIAPTGLLMAWPFNRVTIQGSAAGVNLTEEANQPKPKKLPRRRK